MTRIRIAWIVGSIPARGVGVVCENAAAAVAELADWQVTLLILHTCPEDYAPPPGVNAVCLGAPMQAALAAPALHRWLNDHPQDVILSNDVSRVECYWPFVPEPTRHIAVIHDNMRRYRSAAIEHWRWIDAFVGVARHVEQLVIEDLRQAEYRGITRTVLNGCRYPPLVDRNPNLGPLRLLFMNSSRKGFSDLPLIMRCLKRRNISAQLNIVGCDDGDVLSRLRRYNTRSFGWIPRDSCFQVAAETDVLIQTSRRDSFGLVTVEAMSMGCVPLGYDIVSGNQEIIEHQLNGFLIPLGQFDAFAAVISELDTNRDRLAAMSAAAVQSSRTKFSAERMGQDYLQLIDDVLNRRDTHDAREPISQMQPTERPHHTRLYSKLPMSIRMFLRRLVDKSPHIFRLLCDKLR